jgi:DNA-binding beta-propeller fold protein YncE
MFPPQEETFMCDAFRKPAVLAILVILVFLLIPSTSLADQKVYLTTCCGDGATVSILDSMMLMEMGFVPAGTGTTAVAIGPDNMTGYIALSPPGQAGVVEVIDAMMGTVMMTFPAGNGAVAIAITPDGSTGYIANRNDGSVTIFDTGMGTIKANLPILPGGACLDAGISPDGSKAYIVCQITPNGKPSHSILAIVANNQVVKSIALPGTQPFPGNNLLAITPDGTRAYIAGISTPKKTGFAAVDLTGQRVLHFVGLPGVSYGLAVDPMMPQVLFSSGAGVLNYIDADTGKIQGTTALGSSGKGGVVPYMGGMRVAVASVDDDVVAVIDNTDGRLASSISVGAMPQRVVVSQNEMISLAGTTYTSVVHEFDAVTGQWIADFEGGTAPGGLVVSPDGSMAYVVDQGMPGSGSGSGVMAVGLMMMGQRQWRIPITGASSIAIRPDGRRVYVGSSTGSVSAINTGNGALVRTIMLGAITGSPSLVTSPDNKSLYAAYTQANAANVLSVISTATNMVTGTISLGGGASSAGPFMAVSPDGTRGYVTMMSQNAIAIVDLVHQQLLETVSVGSGVNPACIAIHPNGTVAYVVANTGVLVFDLTSNTVAGTIPISGTPQNVAFTANGSMAYVSVVQGQAAVIDTMIDKVIEQLPASNTIGVTISAQ